MYIYTSGFGPFFVGGRILGAMTLRRVVVSYPKIVKNFPGTYEKIPC